MTCVVGVETPEGVIIGADSATTIGWNIYSRYDGKVFRTGDFVIGTCGSVRAHELIRYAFTPPPLIATDNLNRYLAVDFVNELRSVLKDGGWAKKENEVEEGTTLLVGVHGKLYNISSAYSTCRSTRGYDAIGCGRDFALGVMHTLPLLTPEERIRRALEAAAEHSAGVAGPFVIIGASTDHG